MLVFLLFQGINEILPFIKYTALQKSKVVELRIV